MNPTTAATIENTSPSAMTARVDTRRGSPPPCACLMLSQGIYAQPAERWNETASQDGAVLAFTRAPSSVIRYMYSPDPGYTFAWARVSRAGNVEPCCGAQENKHAGGLIGQRSPAAGPQRLLPRAAHHRARPDGAPGSISARGTRTASPPFEPITEVRCHGFHLVSPESALENFLRSCGTPEASLAAVGILE